LACIGVINATIEPWNIAFNSLSSEHK
jgi:hypothetical protein